MLRPADEFFFIAHDLRTGKPHLPQRTTGFGLAGALIGELILLGSVTVTAGGLAVIDRTPPSDELARRALGQVLSEPELHPLRTWLAFFSQDAANRVGQRLVQAGYVTPQRARRPWGSSVRYFPTNVLASEGATARLHGRVLRGEQLTVAEALLAGLVVATGLARQVWWDGDAEVFREVARWVHRLPPPLHELVAHTEATVGDAVLTQRT
jgi:Golgi phosphoprotein 3 (GPP34)